MVMDTFKIMYINSSHQIIVGCKWRAVQSSELDMIYYQSQKRERVGLGFGTRSRGQNDTFSHGIYNSTTLRTLTNTLLYMTFCSIQTGPLALS